MTKELKDQRVAVMLTPSELAAIDDWSFSQRIRSRGEAIRQLIARGLSLDVYATSLNEIVDVIAPHLSSNVFSPEEIDRLARAMNLQSLQRMRTIESELDTENPSE